MPFRWLRLADNKAARSERSVRQGERSDLEKDLGWNPVRADIDLVLKTGRGFAHLRDAKPFPDPCFRRSVSN